MNNRIGICEWVMPITGPYVCKYVSEIGYDGLQLITGDYEKGFPLSKKVTQQAYLEEAERWGVEFASITTRVTDFFSMFAPVGSEDHTVVRTGVTTAIEIARAMNIDIVMLPNFVKSDARPPERFDRLVSELQWACDLAADNGVLLAEENCMTPEDTIRLFDAVDRDNFRLYFDLQNYYINSGLHTPEIIEPLFPYIVQVHAKDGKNGDLSGAPLGKGDVDLMASLKELQRLGYDGWYVSENYYDVPPLVAAGEDPTETIRNDLVTLRNALGRNQN